MHGALLGRTYDHSRMYKTQWFLRLHFAAVARNISLPAFHTCRKSDEWWRPSACPQQLISGLANVLNAVQMGNQMASIW